MIPMKKWTILAPVGLLALGAAFALTCKKAAPAPKAAPKAQKAAPAKAPANWTKSPITEKRVRPPSSADR